VYDLNQEQKGKTGPVCGAGTMGRAEDIKKGCRKVNIMYTCMLMEK
jgi:hypothetical protein